MHNGEKKACCTLEMRRAWEAQKLTVSKGGSQPFKGSRAVCPVFTQQNKKKRITNVQNKLMKLLKVAFPSYQRPDHQNQTADAPHTLSFMWAFQGTTLWNTDWTAKMHGLMFQVMLSVHMGMWNLIYRREERRRRYQAWHQSWILPGLGPASSAVLYPLVPHCFCHSSP